MYTSHRTKRILHLSNPQVGDATQSRERARVIIRALITNSENRDLFDFIVVTGDIKDRGANPVPAYEKATLFLEELGRTLLRENDHSRILIVPGNHDWSKDSGFLDYNRFVQQWYGDNEQAHCLKSADDEKAPVAYLVVHREDDVVCLLLNSYWEHPGTDRLVIGRVCDAQRQAFDTLLASLYPDTSPCPPKLALMHQHLMQTHDYPEHQRKAIFSQDYSATIEWLSKQKTVVAFHGPPPSYTLLRIDDGHTPQAELHLGTELMSLGAGACCPDDGKPEEEYQFQAIAVNLKPRRFLESTIEKMAYRWDGGNWVSSPRRFTSHDTFSAFQKDLVEAEQFTCDQLREGMSHPLRSEQTDDWFWNHYNELWSKNNPQGPDGGKPSLARKKDFLTELVARLKEHNSSRSIFELLPFQLDAIYTFTAIFFGNADIEEAAICEFKTQPWQSWLKFNDIVDYARWSHLDWANWIIANHIREWISINEPKRVGIVDLGYGLLRTIDAIGRNLPASPVEQRYLGIDVSGDQLQAAKEMIAHARNSSSFFANRKTKPFEQILEYFVEESGRKYWIPNNHHLSALKENGFNVFVCVYAMHHCSNSFRVQKSLQDGTFFRFIAHSPESGREHLEANLGSHILDRLDDSQRRDFLQDLVMLSKAGNSGLSQSRDVTEAIERVLDLAFPDSQLEVYRMVFETIQDGGLLCIADPNGMSRTFNRQEIFRSSAIAVAHFSDWVDAASMAYKAGFRKIRVFRQIRLNSLHVRRVEIPPESIKAIVTGAVDSAGQEARMRSFHENIMKEEFEQFKAVFPTMAPRTVSALEILDQHMGYILIAEKPKGVMNK